MDKFTKATKWAKFVKGQFKKTEQLPDGTYVTSGASHISQQDYGRIFDTDPYTNKYVKKVKQDLKRECRAAKRSDKQDVKKQVQKILLEQE